MLTTVKALLQKKKTVELGFFPTPLYKLEKISAQLGANIYIKRDDFTGQNLFGGNKIRKLEYLLGQAVENDAEYVFTYGATQSNHAMQTAAACRKLGLKPVLYLLDFVDTDASNCKGNLLLDKIFGAEVHIIKTLPDETLFDSKERYMAYARSHMQKLEAAGHKCYSVPLGGSNFIGTTGFVAGYVELEEQLAAEGITADFIFHANGSGGTMAGLAIGKKLLDSSTTIISVDAAEHSADFMDEMVELGNAALQWLGSNANMTANDFCMDEDFFAPSYEIPSEQGSAAIKLLAREEGILLDPVYSGKAFACFLDYVQKGKVPKGSNVIFWHTGGATALFAEKEILGNVF